MRGRWLDLPFSALLASGRGVEQPVERGDGAVVKVRRGGPDTVQRTGAIMRSVWLGIGTVLAGAPEFIALLPGEVLIGHPFPADEVDRLHQGERVGHVR